MKKNILISLLTVLLVLVGSTLSLAEDQVQTKEVYLYASPSMVERLLDAEEIKYKSLELNQYSIELNEYKVFLSIDDGDIILTAFFNGEYTLNRVNEFNLKYRWAKLYLDSDGDLTIQQDLSFTGGITLENIHSFLQTYGVLLDALSAHMQ